MVTDEDDGDGGVSNEERNGAANESPDADEPIYFDQTNRNMGSIQKNMVFSERDRSLMGKGFGRGAATKAMLGLNPASTMPNYTLGINGNVQQPTYKQAIG